jgi:hypothetical protein
MATDTYQVHYLDLITLNNLLYGSTFIGKGKTLDQMITI